MTDGRPTDPDPSALGPGARGPADWHGADGIARRTNPRTVTAAAISMVTGASALVAGSRIQDAITAAATSSDTSSSPVGLLLPGLFLVIAGVVQMIRWATTTYAVLPTELVVDSGLLNREHRVFPFARIQQADTQQNLLAQLLGLTEVKLDVAGSSGSTQLRLRFLDRTTAVALRDHILRRRAELNAVPDARSAGSAVRPPPDGAPAPTTAVPRPGDGVGPLAIGTTVGPGEHEVLRIAPARIAVGALTQPAIAVGLPLVAVGALWLAAFLAVAESSTVGGAFVAVLAAGTAFVLVVTMVVGSMLTYHGFVVSLAGDDIHLRYGLIETRNLTVPRRRVQQVTIVDNPLRRAFGLCELHLHTAAAPGGEGTTRFTIPVLDSATSDHLLRTLLGNDDWQVPVLAPRAPGARRRAIVRRTAIVAVTVAVPAVLLRPLGLGLLVLAGAGIAWGLAAHRRAGHGRSPRLVAFAHGVLHHRVDLVPVDRVQSSRTAQSLFQRRVGLATILLDVAGAPRAPDLWDVDLATATELSRSLPRAALPLAPDARLVAPDA